MKKHSSDSFHVANFYNTRKDALSLISESGLLPCFKFAGFHGLSGFIKVNCLFSFCSFFSSYLDIGAKLYCTNKNEYYVKDIKGMQATKPIVFFGSLDRDLLENILFCLKRDELISSGCTSTALFMGALVSCPKNNVMGRVVGVYNFGAGDLLDVYLFDKKDTVFIPSIHIIGHNELFTSLSITTEVLDCD